MDTAEGPQKITGRRPQPFDSVGMNFSHPITVIISCPFVLAVTDRAVCPLDLVVALPFIGVTLGRPLGIPMHVLLQSLAVRMLTDSQAALPTLSANGPNNRWPVIFIGAVPTLLVSSAPRRIQRIGVLFAFFPPRSETSPPSLCLDPATPARLTAHSRWPGVACASARHTGARARVPPLRRLPVRPCRSHALTTRSGVGPSYSLQRWSQYRGYRFAGRYGSDNQQSRACAGEPHAPVPVVLRSLGSADLGGESISPPTPDFHVHRVTRLWEKSLSFLTTECTN